MKLLIILISLIFTQQAPPANIYRYNFKTIDGKQVSLSKFKGRKILIANTASKCGFTPQYEGLEKLHKVYGKDIVVIGFPAGNFGGEELATSVEIGEFCKKNYGVTFLLSEKISVKGDDIDPLFKYLTTAANSDFTGDIKWNFEKFLINEQGQLVHRFRSAVIPMSPDITKNL
jgi:glutathione peroxidase